MARLNGEQRRLISKIRELKESEGRAMVSANLLSKRLDWNWQKTYKLAMQLAEMGGLATDKDEGDVTVFFIPAVAALPTEEADSKIKPLVPTAPAPLPLAPPESPRKPTTIDQAQAAWEELLHYSMTNTWGVSSPTDLVRQVKAAGKPSTFCNRKGIKASIFKTLLAARYPLIEEHATELDALLGLGQSPELEKELSVSLPEPVSIPPLEQGEENMVSMTQKPIDKDKLTAPALPDDVLLAGCQFIRSSTWREFNNKGIKTLPDLICLVKKHGGIEEAFKALGVPTGGHALSSIRDKLELLEKHAEELGKISPEEANKIVGRLKQREQYARQKAGKKASSARPAQSKASPASALQTLGEPSAIESALAVLAARAEFREAMGELAGVVKGLLPNIKSLAAVGPLLTQFDQNLALISDRSSLDDGDRQIIAIARQLRAIHDLLIGKQ